MNPYADYSDLEIGCGSSKARKSIVSLHRLSHGRGSRHRCDSGRVIENVAEMSLEKDRGRSVDVYRAVFRLCCPLLRRTKSCMRKQSWITVLG